MLSKPAHAPFPLAIKALFAIVPVVFLAYYLMSFIWPEPRILGEASNDLFSFYAGKFIAIPMNRYAIVQNKILPWLLSMVGAPFKVVVYSYLINDLLFYLFFVTVALWLKEYLLAVFFLLFNLLLWKHNFFILSSELYLTLPWLFLWGVMLHRNYLNYWLLVPIMLIVLWSHPVCIVVFVMLNFLFGYERKLSKWFIAVFVTIVLLRVWVVSAYDVQVIGRVVASGSAQPTNSLSQYFDDYCGEYFVYIVLAFFWLLRGQVALWRKLALVFAWGVLFGFAYKSMFEVLDMNFTKWLLPLHFIGIYAFYLYLADRGWHKRWALLITFFFVGDALVSDTMDVHQQFSHYRQQARNLHCLVSTTQSMGYSKSYVIVNEFEQPFSDNKYQQESIILSQFPDATTPVQVVMIDKALEPTILQLPIDEYYIGPECIQRHEWLKPPFVIKPDVYRKLSPQDCGCLAD